MKSASQWRLSAELTEELKRLSTRKPVKKQLDWSARYSEGRMDQEVFESYGLLMPAPSQKFSSVVKTLDGELVYDIEYTIDEYSRRFHKKPLEEADHFIAFLGGSFVLGEGVEDHETLPARLDDHLEKTNVYNLGGAGQSIFSFLLETSVWPDSRRYLDLKGQTGIAVYMFVDFHVNRFVGSTLLFRENWGFNLPKFRRKPGTEDFQYLGRFKDNFTLWDRLSLKLSELATVRFFRIDFPIISMSHLKDYAQGVANVKKVLREKHGIEKFIFLAGPYSHRHWVPQLLEIVRNTGIDVIDYSNVDETQLTKGHSRIQYDGHPSPLMNRILAEVLAKDLQQLGYVE